MLLRTRTILFSCIFSVFLLPISACAQTVPITFSLTTTPAYPQPGSTVTLVANSDTIDLVTSTMTVTVNGTTVYEGNVSGVPITLAQTGSTVIKAILSTDLGDYTQTLVISPQSVALIAEPLSSVPPLYPGKALIPAEGRVRFVAVASFYNTKGTLMDPAKLSYTWKIDGKTFSGLSGIGKSSIVADSPLEYRSRTVDVTVKSQEGSLSGGDTFTFSSDKPTVRIYKNDPLLGILFDHALSSNQKITGAEFALYAAPFSFSTTNGSASVNWFLNTAAAQSGNTITLRPTGNGQGTASVSCTVRKGDFAVASQSLSVEFGSTDKSNFFGL